MHGGVTGLWDSRMFAAVPSLSNVAATAATLTRAMMMPVMMTTRMRGGAG